MAGVQRAAVIVAAILLLSCSKESQNWTPLPLGTSADFRDVCFSDATHGLIGGGSHDVAGGLVGRTADGGQTWTFTSGMIGTSEHARGRKITSLHCLDRERALAATDAGAMFVTGDGGSSWGEVPGWPHGTGYLFDLEFVDEEIAFAAGLGGVFRTEDGGETWAVMARKKGEERIQARAIAMLDYEQGFLIGQHATLLETADGGITWSDVELPFGPSERPDFWDLLFVDESTGWIVGEEGTLLRTRDGGATWERRALGISGLRTTPKLETIERGGRKEVFDAGDTNPGLTLSSIAFADAQHGWITGFFANMGRSLILRTIDGGATWEIDADIEGEELRALFALDRDHVWATGARVRPGKQSIYIRRVSA